MVNHIKKERRVQQCARIQVKNISCDNSKVVLSSPGSGEKWQRLLLPCHLYITTTPALWGRVFLFVFVFALSLLIIYLPKSNLPVSVNVYFCLNKPCHKRKILLYSFCLSLSLRRKASPAVENFHLWALSPEQVERLESKWDFRTGPFSDNLSKESGPELLLGRHEK